MKIINFWVDGDRKLRVKEYCRMRGITTTQLMTSMLIRELSENYEMTRRLYKRNRLHDRAKAYRYLRTGRQYKSNSI